MKKEYINPEMEVVKIATMSVLADSYHLNDEEGDGDVMSIEFFGGGDSTEEW